MMKYLLVLFAFITSPVNGDDFDFLKDVYRIQREAAIKTGVLQAYWLPVWHDREDVNSSILKLRFFSFEEKGIEVINIDGVDKEFLGGAFWAIPDSFINNKQGHVEQYGRLEIKNIRSYTECNHVLFYAEKVSFIAEKRDDFDLDKLESSSGCEKYPYVITYVINSDIKNLYFKDEPNDNTGNLCAISAGAVIISIDNVNDEWIYAAVYDEASPGLAGTERGYINRKYVTPVK